MTIIEKALQHLSNLVYNKGMEYPDAHSATCERFNLKGKRADALTTAYDEQSAAYAKRRNELDRDPFHPNA